MKAIFFQLAGTLNGRARHLPPLSLRAGFVLSVLVGLPLLAMLAYLFGGTPGVGLSLAVFLGGAWVAALAMSRSYPHRDLGLCNAITIGRLALTSALTALLAAPMPPSASTLWLAFAVALLALSLDGVDGWAARRAGLTSRFGARFDMEVDSLFALILSIVAFQTGQAGAWILVLGVPRYLFVTAGTIWPSLKRELPDTRSRKAVCVLQIGTLIAFLVPVLPGALLTSAAAIAAVALIWSFLRDIRVLLGHRQ